MTTCGRRRVRVIGVLILALSPPLSGCDRSPPAPAGGEAATERARTLADAVASARPGDTIVLPTGTYEGGIRLPPRVSLRGAGARKTIIDARKVEVGLAIEGGRGGRGRRPDRVGGEQDGRARGRRRGRRPEPPAQGGGP